MITKGKEMLKQAFNSKKKRKSTTGYPLRDPNGAKPMGDPQLDMRTWKPPVKTAPAPRSGSPRPPFTPGARFAKKKGGKNKKKVMCKKNHKHTKMC